MDSAAVHKVVVEEAIRQHQNHVVVSLSWRPARPTDSDPATAERIQEPLSDFEWNQLLTPGTNLNKLWIDQVDAVARSLKELADANVAVLWQPYPESNGKKFWWAGRKGTQGSMALYRRLFDRLTNHDKLRNLIWVWTSVPPAGFGPAAEGQYKDFFPGLGYVDALALNIDVVNPRGRADTFLAMFALGKPIGLGLAAEVPESFPPQSKWAWFILGSSVPAPANSGAIIKLYSDPRTVSSNQK